MSIPEERCLRRSFPLRLPFRERRTYVTYGLAGDDLDPVAVATHLGLQPHWGFARGDVGTDGIRNRWGVWGIGSWDLSHSDDPSEHLRAMLELLGPVLPRLQSLIESERLTGRCQVTQQISPGRFGYTIDVAVLRAVGPVISSLEISYIVDGFIEPTS